MRKPTKKTKTVKQVTVETLVPEVREVALRLAGGDRARIQVVGSTEALVK